MSFRKNNEIQFLLKLNVLLRMLVKMEVLIKIFNFIFFKILDVLF